MGEFEDSFREVFPERKNIQLRDYFRWTQPGMCLEFGVFEGKTLNLISRYTTQPVYGFDSFEGLPEDWVIPETGQIVHRKGVFKCQPPVNLQPHVELVVGFFEDTLPTFLETHPEPIGLIHMDCDLYSSHKCVFDLVKDRLDGTIIVFDDLEGFEHNMSHGYRAFKELFEEVDYAVTYLGHHNYPPGLGFMFEREKNAKSN